MKPILVLLLLIAVSCKSQKGAGNTSESELNLVLSDYYYGGEAESIQIIREEGALKKFFMKLNQTRKPGLAVPEVDFTKELVILYTGSETVIDSIPNLYVHKAIGTQLLLRSKTAKKQNSLKAATSGTSFQIYTLPTTDKEIVLVEEK